MNHYNEAVDSHYFDYGPTILYYYGPPNFESIELFFPYLIEEI